MTLYIILAVLWFLSGAAGIMIFVLFLANDDYKVSDILPTIMGGMIGFPVLFFAGLATICKNDKILIKRRK